jgi:RNA polymerase sigma-70 factor (ECF subfamily)
VNSADGGGGDEASGLQAFRVGTPGHRQLFGMAYRMLGSVHDAEDALQEGFRRWQELAAEQRSLIREPAAWLTRVISRICLDELGTARARREKYTGFWLPEPVLGSAAGAIGGAGGAIGALGTQRSQAADPADVVTLDESVSMALLVAMEQLSPAERVSLILHDVFGVPFARSPASSAAHRKRPGNWPPRPVGTSAGSPGSTWRAPSGTRWCSRSPRLAAMVMSRRWPRSSIRRWCPGRTAARW